METFSILLMAAGVFLLVVALPLYLLRGLIRYLKS